MSQYNGSKDADGMQQVFRFKLLVNGIVGVGFAVLCFIAPRGLYWLMVTKNVDASAILDQTQIYSRAVALSFVFMVFSQSIATSLGHFLPLKPKWSFGPAHVVAFCAQYLPEVE